MSLQTAQAEVVLEKPRDLEAYVGVQSQPIRSGKDLCLAKSPNLAIRDISSDNQYIQSPLLHSLRQSGLALESENPGRSHIDLIQLP